MRRRKQHFFPSLKWNSQNIAINRIKLHAKRYWHIRLFEMRKKSKQNRDSNEYVMWRLSGYSHANKSFLFFFPDINDKHSKVAACREEEKMWSHNGHCVFCNMRERISFYCIRDNIMFGKQYFTYFICFLSWKYNYCMRLHRNMVFYDTVFSSLFSKPSCLQCNSIYPITKSDHTKRNVIKDLTD